MKKLLPLILLSSIYSQAHAGLDDAQLTLSISEFTTQVFVERSFDQILLDIEQSPRVFKANGALYNTVSEDGFPVTGTCSLTPDGVFCAINASFATIYLDLTGELNGTYLVEDPVRTVIAEGTVTFESVE